jgi:hypothetical protein
MFLLEIITLVSSVKIMGSDKVLIVGCRSVIHILKRKALYLTLGELHVSLFSSLRKTLSYIK